MSFDNTGRKAVLVTGGAGFIGANLVRRIVRDGKYIVANLDRLGYAGHLESLAGIEEGEHYSFFEADICDGRAVESILQRVAPHFIIHLAAETHVDRSIDSPAEFLETNVRGTFNLLEAARGFWRRQPPEAQSQFRFLHVSTDEVYGSLGAEGFFDENSPHRPRNPYSATKAASDHLAGAWYSTYGLPTIITHSANNYGPHQFPEKLIPLVILRALAGEQIPVYGNGENIRDWIYVEDHAAALIQILEKGRPGETYNVSSGCERRNVDVVQEVCRAMDRLAPRQDGAAYATQISFVADRPGHDLRYASGATKLRSEIGWRPRVSFEEGLERTVAWYLQNRAWCEQVREGNYAGERLGLRHEKGET